MTKKLAIEDQNFTSPCVWFFSPEKKLLGCFELRIHQELRNASHPNIAMINEMNVKHNNYQYVAIS